MVYRTSRRCLTPALHRPPFLFPTSSRVRVVLQLVLRRSREIAALLAATSLLSSVGGCRCYRCRT